MKQNLFKINVFILVLFISLCIPSLIVKGTDIYYSNYLEEIEYKNQYLDTFEVTLLRDEYTKHYYLRDGTFKSITYGVKIHNLENNKYIDIYKTSDMQVIIPNDDFIGGNESGIYDTYISSTRPNTNYGYLDYMKVDSASTTLIQINKPTLPNNVTISSAIYSIPYYFQVSSNNTLTVGIYEISNIWSEGSATYNNTTISNTLLDEEELSDSYSSSNMGLTSFYTTELVCTYYSDLHINNGIAIKYLEGSASSLYFASIQSGEVATLSINYSIEDLIIENNAYYIKNCELGNYIQIDNNDEDNNYSSNNAILELWDYTGNNEQKWYFKYLNNGYYRIVSAKSGKAITVRSGEENSNNVSLIQIDYNGSFNQQFKITKSNVGLYIIKPRSSESYSTNRVMSAGSSLLGSNGRNVEQRNYSNNNNYLDEWIITLKKTSYTIVFNYYDNGFLVRHNKTHDETKVLINDYMQKIANVYYNLLDLTLIFPDPVYYESDIDICKGTVTTSNINTLCTHSGTVHTDFDNLLDLFRNDKPKIKYFTNALWTGHRVKLIIDEKPYYFRSCSSGKYIFMLNNSISESSACKTLIHELLHQLGAPDHYHEGPESEKCINHDDGCSICSNNPRLSRCLMGPSSDSPKYSDTNPLCNDCLNDVISFIEDNCI